MAAKNLGLGTVLTCDGDTITLAVDATPPARKRVNIDGSVLSETLATYEPGIEDFSEYMWTQLWEPGDTDHEAIDGLFDSKAAVVFTIVYADSGNTVETFSGKVSDIEPQPITKDGLLSRKVTVQRTTPNPRTT
jgi:hypothetical protein